MAHPRQAAGPTWAPPGDGVVVYAPGIFDLFHIGHLNLLRQAARYGDYLIAGVLTDEQAEESKGLTPTVPFEERIAIVSANQYVDWAEPEDVPDKVAMWDRLRFDAIVKGDDWQGTERGARLEAAFAPLGVEIVYVPYTPTTSSTQLRAALGHLAEGVA